MCFCLDRRKTSEMVPLMIYQLLIKHCGTLDNCEQIHTYIYITITVDFHPLAKEIIKTSAVYDSKRNIMHKDTDYIGAL